MPILLRVAFASFASLLVSCSSGTPDTPPMSEQELSIYQAEIEGRHAQRIERLSAPDGWLSLVGLHWVEPGLQRIGSAPDNDIVLSTGPDYLAAVLLAEGQVSIDPNEEGGGWHEPGKDGLVGRLRFNDGGASIQVIERGGRTALRVRDARAPTRTGFTGIERFATDPGWRFDAAFEAHDPPRTLPVVDVLGNSTDTPNPGSVSFTYAGKRYSLEALDEGDGRLFFVFADRTSSKETYGGGRMLYADPAVNGRTVLDFNLAYNPPCAFTEYSTCPLPPPENRLDLAVRAGEKRYRPEN